MNRIELTGRLTQDPDLQTTTTGKSNATLRLAIDRRDRDAHPVYVDVKCWNGLADTCAKFLSKGRLVASPGAWTTRSGRPRTAIGGGALLCVAGELEGPRRVVARALASSASGWARRWRGRGNRRHRRRLHALIAASRPYQR